jgi:shikimate dehydrogenase
MSYGLIGQNIEYSFSKDIHGRLASYEYLLHSLDPAELDAFMKRGDFEGLNVTIPYKQMIMEYCDEISPAADRIGAVNTIYRKNGKLVGTNTDYDGFCYLLDKAGIDVSGKTVLILGSGGAQATVRTVCMDRNASAVYVASRDPDRKAETEGLSLCSYDDLPESAEIVINTTPLGTHPNYDDTPLDLAVFPNCEAVIDLIYNPIRTSLLLQAMDMGKLCTNGLAMLVGQAEKAREYFASSLSGDEVDEYDFASLDEACGDILKSVEKEKTNFVIIGMPGCGKTRLGKDLSRYLDRLFIDCDEFVTEKEGRDPAEIIQDDGEEAFRDIESECIKELAGYDGIIIATGGGAVLREKNMKALRHKGIIIYLDTPTFMLDKNGRPLSKDDDALEKMLEERLPLYEKYANITVYNHDKWHKTFNKAYAILK